MFKHAIAGDDIGFALTASPATAEKGRIDASSFHRFEDALPQALLPLGREHSAGMFVLWSSDLVCRYSGVVSDVDGNTVSTPVKSVADSDLIIEFWMEARRAGWGCRWVLELCGTGEFVGAIGFNALGEVCVVGITEVSSDSIIEIPHF